MQARSTIRMCKGRDIAVILSENMGEVDVFFIQIKIIKKIK